MALDTWVFLHPLRRADDVAVLLLRLVTGAFLIHGVWDNITDAARMQEFVEFLTTHGFAAPAFMARLSVWVQFGIGLAFVAGLLTRWAGLLCAANFIVACVMVHWSQDLRGWWPALVLVLIGLLLATRGAGRYSLDAVLGGAERSVR
ncbi:DoxX family protein [Lysobacter korlensis]|uniref:DoxX family protein n=1 Tax=Lysobacter korlensis TaxID=553636 RepID=A0ABV6RIE0_9GAMM